MGANERIFAGFQSLITVALARWQALSYLGL